MAAAVAMGIGNIGWSELLVIGIIVLVFFGPRRLPEIANAVGRSLREFRKALNEVRTEISQAGSVSEPPIRPPVPSIGESGARSPEPDPAGPDARAASGPVGPEPPIARPPDAGAEGKDRDGDAGDPQPEEN